MYIGVIICIYLETDTFYKGISHFINVGTYIAFVSIYTYVCIDLMLSHVIIHIQSNINCIFRLHLGILNSLKIHENENKLLLLYICMSQCVEMCIIEKLVMLGIPVHILLIYI